MFEEGGVTRNFVKELDVADDAGNVDDVDGPIPIT
jgi:hypothetical protein